MYVPQSHSLTHKKCTKIIPQLNACELVTVQSSVQEQDKDETTLLLSEKGLNVSSANFRRALHSVQLAKEEGIDYDEVFALVARIEAIRLFLAYASYMGFMVYQMDIKSAFLYGQIEEEVVKALYGLHQAPRAWYDTLVNYLLSNGFESGKIDQTLFIKRHKGHILLVQIYVDDIIFGSTKKELCDEFEKLMKDKFQMSSMGELTFFLGLQISKKPLVQDGDAAEVDEHLYRSMIGSLMYLTASRPDIMFAVCACARFQVSPKSSHLLAVKRIFRYLKGKPSLGLWYSKDSPLELVAYTDSDYAGATQDRKSTTGGCQFLGNRLISWQCKKQTVVATSTTEAEYVVAASCCGQVLWIQNQLLDYGYKFMNTVIYIDNNNPPTKVLMRVDFSTWSQSIVNSQSLMPKSLVMKCRVSSNHRFPKSKSHLLCTHKEARVDGHSMTITEGSLRRHLKLDDQDGISSIPNSEIFEQLALMGYHTDSDKLTFQKGAFSPQWRFLIHSILHCLSPKKTAWEQFSSNIATAVICLATNRKYNFL
ncbi:putative ribonuclease H-like domain-containing protein [Tanacetum coccineum]